jgi:hypothetical protein
MLLAGLAFGVSRIEKKIVGRSEAMPSATARATAVKPVPVQAAASVEMVGVGEKRRPLPKKPPLRAPGVRPPPVESETATARVRIAVDGPASATVRMDGVVLPDWFGTQEIAVGTHVFEFIPPNTECCDMGERLTVEIRPSSGPNPQTVRGRIAFKDAMLELRGTPGSRASCGELGEFPVPSRQTFGMTTAMRRASCTLIPPPGSGLPLKPFDVTLSPGRVSSVPPGP